MSKLLIIKTKERIEPNALHNYLTEEGFKATIDVYKDSLAIYMAGLSTRYISIEWKDDECTLKINALSSIEDYKMFRAICFYMLKELQGEAEYECEDIDLKSLQDLLTDKTLEEYVISDVRTIIALIKYGIKDKGYSEITIFGPKREYSVGGWVVEKLCGTLDCKAEEIAPLLIEDIRRVQYCLPENLRANENYLSFKNKDGEEMRMGYYKFNEFDITTCHSYLLLYKTDFIDDGNDIVVIDTKNLPLVAPSSWARIDEKQFLTSDLTEQEYIDFWNRAKEYESEDFTNATLKISDYKIHIVGVKTDQRLYALLCRQLSSDGYTVYPSADSIDRGEMPTKERMLSVEDCDVAILMQTRNTGRNKQYQKEVMRLIAIGKPFITISVNREDILSSNGLPYQPEIFSENPTMSVKYKDLRADIAEMCQWIDTCNDKINWKTLDLPKEDYKKGDALYEKGREAYANGDFQTAYDNWVESSNMGFPYSMVRLAFLLSDDDSEESKRVRFNLITRASQYGILPAIRTMGNYYEEGIGCEKDLDMALYWFKLAAKEGVNPACGNIADLYDNGEYFKRNLGKALFWTSNAHACERDDDEAEFKEDFERLLDELFGEYD